MKSESEDHISLTDEEGGFDVLEDIEKQATDHHHRERTHERISVKAKVILQPGNASEFLSYKVQGIVGDISAIGCHALFPIPIQVGDIYRLQFEKEELDLPLIFARCLRCRLISEDKFETGFSFFSPINLPQELIDKNNFMSVQATT